MKIIITLLFAATIASAQSTEFRSSIYPKTPSLYDIGDASHYWRSIYVSNIIGESLVIGGVSITDERGAKIVMTDGETGDVTTLSATGLDLGQEDGVPYYAHIGSGVGPGGEQGVSFGVSGIGIDTKLYRSAANELTTPGKLIASSFQSSSSVSVIRSGGSETAGSGFISLGDTDPEWVFRVRDYSTGGNNLTIDSYASGSWVKRFEIDRSTGSATFYDATSNRGKSLVASSEGNPGIQLISYDASSSERNWGFSTSVVVYGDFALRQSNAQGGNPYGATGTTALYFDASRNATFSAGVTLGASSSTVAGTIRWTGVHFEGYTGSTWEQLDN